MARGVTLEVREHRRISGEPQWIEADLRRINGQDPLGFETITNQAIALLLPGTVGLARRARYLSFHVFLIDEFHRRHLGETNTDLFRFIRRREYDYALAVRRCERDGCGGDARNVIGSLEIDRRHASAGAGPFPRGDSVKTEDGGYGLNYRTPLEAFNLVDRREQEADGRVYTLDFPHGDRGAALAEHFRQVVQPSSYWKRLTDDRPLSAAELSSLAERACLCRLASTSSERQALLEALFDESDDDPTPGAATARRRSFAVFLDALHRDPAVVHDEGAFRRSVWRDAMAGAGEVGRRDVVARWAALFGSHYRQDGLSLLWAQLLPAALASQPPEGLTRNELNELVITQLVGEGIVDVAGTDVDCDPDQPASTFIDAVAQAWHDGDIEDVRTWALTVDDDARAFAGLVLLAVLLRRLPVKAAMPPGWSAIASMSAQYQPSLLDFARRAIVTVDGGGSLGALMDEIVYRHVIRAHEAVAAGKPDSTFRFRSEGGRVRFYSDLALDRPGLFDTRHPAMTSLSRDLGLWEWVPDGDDAHKAVLTSAGQHFVAEEFP